MLCLSNRRLSRTQEAEIGRVRVCIALSLLKLYPRAVLGISPIPGRYLGSALSLMGEGIVGNGQQSSEKP
jgi:hypothetical protein